MKISAFVIIFAWLLSGCTSLGTQEGASDQEAAQLNLQLGIRYMQNGRFNVAEEKLRKALQYNVKLAEAENALGVLYEATDKVTLAQEHFQRAIGLKPDYVLARMNYGRILCANGNAELGLQQFLEAAADPLLEAPENAYTGAGVCARRHGDKQQAFGYFQLALNANPEAAATLFEMAGVSQELGRPQEAQQYLERYHKRANFSPASLKLAMEIAAALGQTQQHAEYKELLRSRFTNSAEAQSIVQ